MITIETAQIAFLQTVLPENQAMPIVDKEAFLQNLKSFLNQQSETSGETQTLLAEQGLEAVESSEGEEIDLELEEEVIQALFSHLTFPWVASNEKLADTKQSLHIEMTDEIPKAIQPSTNQEDFLIAEEATVAEGFPEIVQLDEGSTKIETEQPNVNPEATELIETETLETRVVEKLEPAQAEKSVRIETSENNKLPEVLEIRKTQLVNSEDDISVEAAFLGNKEFVEDTLTNSNNTADFVKKDVTRNTEVVLPVSLRNTTAEPTPIEAKRFHTSEITQEIPSVNKLETTTQPIDNWFTPIQQVTSAENIAETGPIQVSQEQWIATVEELVVEQVQTAEGNQVTKTHMALTPEHLGKMDMELMIENKELFVKIAVEHKDTKHWIESQLTTLTNQLATQEISIVSIQIDVAPTLSNPFTFNQQQQASQENQFSERKHWKRKGHSDEHTNEQEVSHSTMNSARGLSLWA